MTPPHQAPLRTGFSRQKHWTGLPCPSPVDPPDPGIGPRDRTQVFSLQADSLPFEPQAGCRMEPRRHRWTEQLEQSRGRFTCEADLGLKTQKPRNCKSVTQHSGILRETITVCLPFKFLISHVPASAAQNWKTETEGAPLGGESPMNGTECRG